MSAQQDLQKVKAPHCHVPLVAIGVNRDIALAVESALKSLNRSNYPLVACLDMHDSPIEYQYSPHNLSTVLRASHPRPKGLITGTAVTDEVLKEIEQVWEAYVESVIVEENLGGHCWVKVSSTKRLIKDCRCVNHPFT